MVHNAGLAAALLRQNLEAVCDSISDRRMAKNIADAVISDGRLLATSVQEGEVTARDRETAQQLHDGRETLTRSAYTSKYSCRRLHLVKTSRPLHI